jgi:hypothetical protein
MCAARDADAAFADAAPALAAQQAPPAAGWRVQLHGSWLPDDDARQEAASSGDEYSGVEPWGADEPAVVRPSWALPALFDRSNTLTTCAWHILRCTYACQTLQAAIKYHQQPPEVGLASTRLCRHRFPAVAAPWPSPGGDAGSPANSARSGGGWAGGRRAAAGPKDSQISRGSEPGQRRQRQHQQVKNAGRPRSRLGAAGERGAAAAAQAAQRKPVSQQPSQQRRRSSAGRRSWDEAEGLGAESEGEGISDHQSFGPAAADSAAAAADDLFAGAAQQASLSSATGCCSSYLDWVDKDRQQDALQSAGETAAHGAIAASSGAAHAPAGVPALLLGCVEEQQPAADQRQFIGRLSASSSSLQQPPGMLMHLESSRPSSYLQDGAAGGSAPGCLLARSSPRRVTAPDMSGSSSGRAAGALVQQDSSASLHRLDIGGGGSSGGNRGMLRRGYALAIPPSAVGLTSPKGGQQSPSRSPTAAAASSGDGAAMMKISVLRPVTPAEAGAPAPGAVQLPLPAAAAEVAPSPPFPAAAAAAAAAASPPPQMLSESPTAGHLQLSRSISGARGGSVSSSLDASDRSSGGALAARRVSLGGSIRPQAAHAPPESSVVASAVRAQALLIKRTTHHNPLSLPLSRPRSAAAATATPATRQHMAAPPEALPSSATWQKMPAAHPAAAAAASDAWPAVARRRRTADTHTIAAANAAAIQTSTVASKTPLAQTAYGNRQLVLSGMGGSSSNSLGLPFSLAHQQVPAPSGAPLVAVDDLLERLLSSQAAASRLLLPGGAARPSSRERAAAALLGAGAGSFKAASSTGGRPLPCEQQPGGGTAATAAGAAGARARAPGASGRASIRLSGSQVAGRVGGRRES